MFVIIKQKPVKLLGLIPLDELGEFRAHEGELLARMGDHVCHEGTVAVELAVVLTRHLVEERLLAVDHFVMGNRQDEVLAPGVVQGEDQFAVDISAEDGVGLEVFEFVVHPSHVPLEVETETAVMRRLSDHRKSGRFLRYRDDAREVGQHILVHALEELDRFFVLDAAVLVRHPFSKLAAVVQVDHGRDCVYAEPVHMELLAPVEGVGDQETDDFRPAEIEGQRAPAFVFCFQFVCVFIEGLSVEGGQSVFVLREVGRDPVHDHADPASVGQIDQILELFRAAVSGCGTVIPRDLIAPGTVEGMLHHGQQFDVCVTHAFDVLDQGIRSLLVRHRGSVIMPFP